MKPYHDRLRECKLYGTNHLKMKRDFTENRKSNYENRSNLKLIIDNEARKNSSNSVLCM